ncbi:MAG: nucleotidyl transferase AbiEii/AbiGii toxin family protein [Deltaproteobacteria bacterium]|nr:nucleotidyl transferase AbiEii/AbiGii toxin family protein [Deltaproteobacteria bacterium]
MGGTPVLAPEQDRALERLSRVPGMDRFYLAGGSAVAWHLGHRISRDIDLFSTTGTEDLGELRERIAVAVPGAEVVSTTEVSLRLRLEGAPVDLVRYRYPLLEPPSAGPRGFAVAGLRDLAAMKLAAIAGRGLRRDFWDLHAILGRSLSIGDAASAYLDRFGLAQPDLYHLARSLTYFADAERDTVFPAGMDASLWDVIKKFFRMETPKLLVGP